MNYLTFINPIDGDMLNEFDGKVLQNGLEIKVQIAAPKDYAIKVNGIPAKWTKDGHEATIVLENYKNTIQAVEEGTGIKSEILVYWLKDATYKYRISIDDCIWCFKDIAQNADSYRSIFENPYMQTFKEVHDLYGTKIHINLFYQTEGFNLSQMPDKYKSEWKENSDWLRLTFHSIQEFPSKPYIAATYEEIKRDYELITNEIIRFAGEELLSPITTVHWGEATIDAARALRTMGIKGLVGYFEFDQVGAPIVSYYLDSERIGHINGRDFWMDNREDIIFAKHDIVLDKVGLGQIYPYLDELKTDPYRGGFVEMLIHEQYFYPYYSAYQPDYRDKILAAVKWAIESGYKPVFLEDVIFG